MITWVISTAGSTVLTVVTKNVSEVFYVLHSIYLEPQKFENRYKLDIKVFDISQSPQLLTEYQYDVPIAILGEEELFRHRANHSKIEAILKTVTAIEKTRKRSK